MNCGLDVLVDPVDDRVDVSNNGWNSGGITVVVAVTSVGHQTVQDSPMGQWVAEITLQQKQTTISN